MPFVRPVIVGAALAAFLLSSASAVAAVRGDFDSSGAATARDGVLLVRQILGQEPLDASLRPLADLDQDGLLLDADVDAERGVILGRPGAAAGTRVRTSPRPGEFEVAVTRETILWLGRPLAEDAAVTDAAAYGTFGDDTLAARIHVSPARDRITLFWEENLPSAARVHVTLHGDDLRDLFGDPLDADGDGTPGGDLALEFDTLCTTGVPGTAITGRVLASELGEGPGGATVDIPLEGVRITVDGAEDTLFALTQADGTFRLEPAPAGLFFVHVDGRQVAGVTPSGAYYPFVGKAWRGTAGHAVDIGTVYLPKVMPGTLQAVSSTPGVVTPITFAQSVLDEHPEMAGVHVEVPGGALFANDGTVGGRVGIAPVPRDRLPGPLPEELDFALVITVQTAGATDSDRMPENFDSPVPACFPNLPNPDTGEVLPPGARTALWSFNHDTGRFEVQGSMTINEDGTLACTDPGVGITAPGWHGAGPGGSGSGSGGGDGTGGPPDCGTQEKLRNSAMVQCAVSVLAGIPKTVPLIGCAIGAIQGVIGAGVDCYIDPGGCGNTIVGQAIGTVIGCIPVVGGVGGIAWSCLKQTGDAIEAYDDCLDGGGEGLVAQGVLPPAGGHIEAEQAEFLAAAGRFYAAVFGTTVWNEVPSAEWPQQMAIINTVLGVTATSSVEGATVTEAESARVHALPRPSTITEGDVTALLDRMSRMRAGTLTPAELGGLAIRDAAIELQAMTTELQARGWRTTLDSVARRIPATAATTDARAGAVGTIRGSLYYRLENTLTGFVQRGMTGELGTIDQVFLGPDAPHLVRWLDPRTLASGEVVFVSPPSGSAYLIPRATQQEGDPADADADGLPDDREDIVGTRPDLSDTDADGVGDRAELLAGTDPLDGRALRTGVIGMFDTPGDALDIAVDGDLLALADGPGGVRFFDVSNATAPRLLGVIAPGFSAKRVSVHGGFAAAVRDDGRVVVIDVSRAGTPVMTGLLPGSDHYCVLVRDGAAWAGGESEVVRFDLASRSETGRVALSDNGATRVNDLALSRGVLFAARPGTLDALSPQDEMELFGSIGAPGFGGAGSRPLRLSAAQGRVLFVHTSGVDVIDASNPFAMSLVDATETPQRGWRQVAEIGDGRMLAATDAASTDDGPHDVFLYRADAPPIGDADVVALFPTPGGCNSVAVADGIGYAADGTSGLAVIRYEPPDGGASAPVVELESSGNIATGLEAASVATLVARATDDVQVRNVEFWVDGALYSNDASYPFETRMVVPPLGGGRTSFNLQARAFDTAGRMGVTPVLDVPIVPDSTPPRVLSLIPPDGGQISLTSARMAARFNEPMQLTSALPSLTLRDAGLDGTPGTDDDRDVAGTVTLDGAMRLLTWNAAGPLVAGIYSADLVPSRVADLAGNEPRAMATWHLTATPSADSDGDGLPNDFETPNGYDPYAVDTDGDGLSDANEDADGDGLTTQAERSAGTGVHDADTDDDDLADGSDCRPLVVDSTQVVGRLQLPGGSDLSGATVVLRAGLATRQVLTSADGTFASNSPACGTLIQLTCVATVGGLIYGVEASMAAVGVQTNFGTLALTRRDADGDGLPDDVEVTLGLSVDRADTDGDGVSDANEDTDGDGLTNIHEVATTHTLPGDADTDDDGYQDGPEVSAGCNPLGSDVTTVAGQVLDESAQPVAGATVRLGSFTPVLTNANGEFAFTNINWCPATVSVTAESTQGGRSSGVSGAVPKVAGGTTTIPAFVIHPVTLYGLYPSSRLRLPNEGGFDGPEQATTADMNLDGRLDIVMTYERGTSAEPDDIVVLPGRGDSSFDLPVVTSMFAEAATPPAIADFDGDTLPDIAAGGLDTFGVPTLVHLVNGGNGSFTSAPPSDASALSSIAHVFAGAFDVGNGPDVLACSAGFGQCLLFFNDGTGHFGGGQLRTLGVGTTAMRVADMDADGDLDIVALEAGTVPSHVRVIPGLGDGTFGAPVEVQEVTFSAADIAVGQFGGGALPDIAVSFDLFGDDFMLLLGDEIHPGTLLAPTTMSLAADQSPGALDVIDLDNDGLDDLVATERQGGVVTARSSGTTFLETTTSRTPTSSNQRSIAVGDFDEDGRADAVSLAGALPPGATFLKGLGDGRVESYIQSFPELVPEWLGLADFNEDGKMDAVALDSENRMLSRLSGNGDGSFTLDEQILAGGTNTGELVVGDPDLDGNADMLWLDRTSNAAFIRRGNGNGTFQPTFQAGVGAGATDLALGNLDAHPRLEVAVANGGAGTVTVLRYNGVGGWPTFATVNVGGSPNSVAVGDFNGDGKGDLAVGDDDFGGLVRFVHGNADGTFAAPFNKFPGPFCDVTALAAADIDEDGKADAVASGGGDFCVINDDFDGLHIVDDGDGWQRLGEEAVVGDFDDDGHLDVAVPASMAQHVVLYLGDGTGAFTAPQTFTIGSGPTDVELADCNGDGKPDLVVAAKGAVALSTLLKR